MFSTGYNFEDFLVKSRKCETKEELFSVYSETVSKHGLNKVLLCLATDHKEIGESAGMNFMHNYPADWMQHYFEKGFDKIDPIMVAALNCYSSFSWDDVAKNLELLPKQKKCLNLGKEAGLNNGICTPLRGANNAIAGLSLASSEETDSFDGQIDLITAYSNQFYLAYRRIGEVAANKKNLENQRIINMALSEREREVLKWTAYGKTGSEIGDILGISCHTVDFHVRKIFEKLEVNHKTLAVVKALNYGLIHI